MDWKTICTIWHKITNEAIHCMAVNSGYLYDDYDIDLYNLQNSIKNLAF